MYITEVVNEACGHSIKFIILKSVRVSLEHVVHLITCFKRLTIKKWIITSKRFIKLLLSRKPHKFWILSIVNV